MAIACLRHWLIAEIVFPKKTYDKIYYLKDRQEKIICPDCGELLEEPYRIYPFCEREAYPFTREDWKKL